MYVVGQQYNRRRDVHQKLGGQQQGGVATPSGSPFIVVFTGDSGENFGYSDHFGPDGTFWYTGEGQVGDMQMVRGNRALRDQLADGKTILVFEYVASGTVRYWGEADCVAFHSEERPDKNQEARRAFIFHLALRSPEQPRSIRSPRRAYGQDSQSLQTRLALLREQIDEKAADGANAKELSRLALCRANAVRQYALQRARGRCESCKEDAPFESKDGPYLEVHHIDRLCDGGPDHPEHVIALCPNCHRRAHYAKDFASFNESLRAKVQQAQPELSLTVAPPANT